MNHLESDIIFSPHRSGLLSFGVRRESPTPDQVHQKIPRQWQVVGILYARPLSGTHGTHYFDAHYHHTPGCRYGQFERLHSFKQGCIGNTQIGFAKAQSLTLLSMVAAFPPKWFKDSSLSCTRARWWSYMCLKLTSLTPSYSPLNQVAGIHKQSQRMHEQLSHMQPLLLVFMMI